MDSSEENIHELEAKLGVLESWWNNPVAMEFRAQVREREDDILVQVLHKTPSDIGLVLLREQALGELRGVRFLRLAIEPEIEELKQAIKTYYASSRI